MDYYLNEYSLRGQFVSIEDFLKSLREKTLPILKRVEQEAGNVIWKKDSFWQCEICNGISLYNIPSNKNERNAETTMLRVKLRKICQETTFGNSILDGIVIKEYQFDEVCRDTFEENNCFIKALETEGKIISFIHPEYMIEKLPIVVLYDETESNVCLDNIFDISWWDNIPYRKTWRIKGKYLVEVRSNEFEYHAPHFHVTCNEFSISLDLKNGEQFSSSRKKINPKMEQEIGEWYQENKTELEEAWERLHNGQ